MLCVCNKEHSFKKEFCFLLFFLCRKFDMFTILRCQGEVTRKQKKIVQALGNIIPHNVPRVNYSDMCTPME